MFLRLALICLTPAMLPGQSKSEFQQILERLDRVEQENRGLASEIRALRQELAASRPKEAGEPAGPAEERLATAEHRIDEQAQSKVEASQRMPVSLTGMLLFNAFLNSRLSGGRQDPTVAALSPGSASDGGTFRQSVLGLKFQGPEIMGGGKVSGAVYMDFFSGSASSLNHLLRLRVATLDVDWKNTSLMFGQDKPIIAPREPNSLAQVGVSPLTAAGNLWLWGPQARLEQRIKLTDQTSLRAQLGVYQTSEPTASIPQEYVSTLSQTRPALEGRFELSHHFGEGKGIDIAPGFHVSKAHILGLSVPSNLFTLDWSVRPVSKIEFTGAFFNGPNPAGLGSLGQGITIFNKYRAVPVHAAGGWAQLSWLATKRVSFNMYGGQESDRAADLQTGEITRNRAYAANFIYRFGPNILAGLEASQIRSTYLGAGNRLTNHYDLGLAYLF